MSADPPLQGVQGEPTPQAWEWVGIGLRQPHYQPWFEARPPLGFVELHSENFFAEGGATLQVLDAIAERSPISLHGVGLGLGSAAGLDEWHLRKLEALVQRCQPVRVSDHACFARASTGPGHTPRHAADLLPLAFTSQQLNLLSSQVMQVQERLKRPILVENLSSYLPLPAEMPEPEFFNELTRRTGCALLLDINNLMVNALNGLGPNALTPEPHALAWEAASREVLQWLHALRPDCVGEIHLAGFGPLSPEGTGHFVDDHSQAPSEAVWQAWRQALHLLGPQPTLIEWDTQLPELDTLLAQAHRAAGILTQGQGPSIGQPQGSGGEGGRHLAPSRLGGGSRWAVPAEADASFREDSSGPALAQEQWTLLDQTLPRPLAADALARLRAEPCRAGLLPYRFHAAATAADVLARAYPALAAAMEPAHFAAMARALWCEHGPIRGDLAQWGGGLAQFVVENPPQLKRGCEGLRPGLAELARLEWVVAQAERAADPTTSLTSLSLLASTDPNHLVLQAAPGACLLQIRPEVWQWWMSRERLAQAQRCGQTLDVWVWREGWVVRAEVVSVAQGPWLRCLLQGCTLSQTLHACTESIDSSTEGAPALDLNAWLAHAVSRQWVAGALDVSHR